MGPRRIGHLRREEVQAPLFASRFMPCPECGASVDRHETRPHRCDAERRLDYQMFALRDDVAAFEQRVRAHLDTPLGRFEAWLARRDVHRRAA